MLIFAGVLAASLVYLWRRGALEWGRSGRHKGSYGPLEKGLP
jgi:hypothetical protein